MHPLTIARAAIQQHGAIQKEAELAGFLALLADLKSEVVVEIGSDAGGTLWAWQQLPSVRRVIGVDLPQAGFASGKPLDPHGSEVVHGDSHDPETLHVLERVLAGDSVDLLFIDGDHAYEGVKADFEMYGPLVRPGGVIAFHDICRHPQMPQVGVDMLWRQLSAAYWRKDEIITDPPMWGGIGVLRRQSVEDLQVRRAQLAGAMADVLREAEVGA